MDLSYHCYEESPIRLAPLLLDDISYCCGLILLFGCLSLILPKRMLMMILNYSNIYIILIENKYK